MNKKKYFLVINPIARSSRSIKDIDKILSMFKEKKLPFSFKMTAGPDEAVIITDQAIKQGYEIIVAVGGDGTICEVITGFLIDSRKPSSKLGVIHVGTSPDFNRYHGIPTGVEKSIDAIIKGKTKIIDVGKIRYQGFSSEKNIAYFGSNVNIGLGPLIAGKANARHRKYLGDFIGTLLACLQSLCIFKGVDLNTNIDGESKTFNNLINLTVGKDPYLASGMRVFNKITSDDGQFYILSIEKRSLISLISNIPKLYIGNLLDYEAVKIRYGREIEIKGCSAVEFDGDLRGRLPANISVVPKALEVIVG